MKNKWLNLAIVVTLTCTSFVGCSKDKAASNDDLSKKLKYSINVLGAEKHGKDAAYKYMMDKFGVEFEFIPVSFNDWNEKTRIWVSTSDMPDIMWADIQNYNFNEYISWVKQGAVKELPSLDKYPNLQKWADKTKATNYFMVDGKRYAWLSNINNDQYKDVMQTEFFYRKDWAEKLGMAKDEYTWDEFIELARAFKDKDPGGNGPGKTIALAGMGGGFPHFAGLMQSSPYWEQYVKKDGKYVWGMGEPETLAGIKIAKKLYDDGILWKDQVIAKNDDGINKFQAGEVGICFNGWSVKAVSNVRDNIKKIKPDLNVNEAVVPMIIKAPDGKLFGQSNADYWSITTLNAKMSDEKVSRIMKLFDWVASDEGYEMAKYGVKGIDYTENNGQKQFLNSGVDTPNHILKTIIRGMANYNLEDTTLSKSSQDTIKGMIDRYSKDDVTIRKVDYDLYFFNATNKNKYGTMYEEGKEKIKQLIISSNNIESDWNEWKKSVQPKIDLVLSELNSGLK